MTQHPFILQALADDHVRTLHAEVERDQLAALAAAHSQQPPRRRALRLWEVVVSARMLLTKPREVTTS